jgi:hypothetical protein
MDGPSSQRKYTRIVSNINRRHYVWHLSLVTVLRVLVVSNECNAKFCVLLSQATIENCICVIELTLTLKTQLHVSVVYFCLECIGYWT